jgi:hypothetical protein
MPWPITEALSFEIAQTQTIRQTLLVQAVQWRGDAMGSLQERDDTDDVG